MTETFDFGKTIARLRKENGWTQVELAAKLNVSDKAVSKWESGAGVPSTEFYPLLSDLFRVTTDFLLTGKSPEPPAFISKIKYCAKTDDPSMLDEVKDKTDENGKSLMDYILQYESLKVLAALVNSLACDWELLGKSQTEKKKLIIQAGRQFTVLFGKACVYCNIDPDRFEESAKLQIPNERLDKILILLVKAGCEQKILLPLTYKSNNSYSYYFDPRNDIHDRDKQIRVWEFLSPAGAEELTKYLAGNYKNLPDEQRKFYFSNWYAAYPRFAELAYEANNEKLLNSLLDNIEKWNAESEEELNRLHQTKKPHIKLPRDLALDAYKKGDEKRAERLNSLADKPISEYEIKAIRIDNDKMKTALEKQIEKSFRGKLLCVDDLMEIDDYETVRKLLFSNPVHYLEIFYEMIRREQWGELAEYAKELEIPCIEILLAKNDHAKIEQYIYDLYWSLAYFYKNDGDGRIRQQRISFSNPAPSPYLKNNGLNGKYLPLWIPRYYEDCPAPKRMTGSLATCVSYIDECKEEILKLYLAKKEEKRKQNEEQEKLRQTTQGITKESLLKDLNHGETETVIVQLCKVFEAKMRYIHHCSGTLYEIAERASDTHDTAALLKRLIKNHEALTAPDVCAREITPNELKTCIKYIFDKIPSKAN